MAAGPETLLVRRIVRAIEREWPEAWTFKVHGSPFQPAGLPDLLVLVRGRLVGIEVKAQRPGESREHALARVTLRQQAALERLARAGAGTGVALEVAEALDLVRAHLSHYD